MDPVLTSHVREVHSYTLDFYRRHGKYGWTPWEQITLDIEDNPVIPVVWNGRLLLFWLRILQQAPFHTPPTEIAEKNLIDLQTKDVASPY